MYAEHVPIIAAGMRDNHITFVRGALFAVLSARVPFQRVPELLADVDRNGSQAQSLFAWKWDAYAHLTEHGEQLWGSLCRSTDIADALWSVTRVPGVGIVKGAFILQLMGFDVACLDTRNIKREGRNPRAYRSDGEAGKATPAFRAKIDRYIADCGGRAQEYWDTWCNDLGQQYGTSGEDISRRHLTAIIPRRETQTRFILTAEPCPVISLVL
jgi:hypothetical protein